ncbi:hypothetical protein [Amycolatopsis palatopharyngis]
MVSPGFDFADFRMLEQE